MDKERIIDLHSYRCCCFGRYCCIIIVIIIHSSASDAFYGLFYLGLYNEARFYNQKDDVGNSKAAGYMRQALQTPYAVASNDYMVACARVHAQRRGWTM
jgi:hypothetical protein